MAAHGRPDLLEVGEHRARPADAVETDDVGASGFEPFRRLGRSEAVPCQRLAVQRHRHDRREPRLLDHVERDQRLVDVRERLGDDEVHARLDGPPGLLLEHRADAPARLVVAGEDVRVREVACEERARLVRDLARELERAPVQRLEQVLLADDSHLLAVPVVRERLDDVRAGVDELPVQLGDDLGMLEHDLGDVGAGLEVPTPLALEQVPLGADDGALLEAVEQTGSARRHDAQPTPRIRLRK